MGDHEIGVQIWSNPNQEIIRIRMYELHVRI